MPKTDGSFTNIQRFSIIRERVSHSTYLTMGLRKLKSEGSTARLWEIRHEGRRYRIGTIKIEGADVISGEAILDGFGLRRGDIADAGKIRSYFVDTLTEMYGERGYADVYVDITFDFDEPNELGLEGVVNFGIQIDEGQRYEVDKIEFPGLPQDEADSLKTEFELKVGDVYQPSKLKAGIDRINQQGRYEFIDSDSDVELLREIITDTSGGNFGIVIHLRKKAQ